MPRGGPGVGDAKVHTVVANFGGMPSDRLVSGFLTVNVRNKHESQRDANHSYWQGWRHNPNNIAENEDNPGEMPEGTYPFWADPLWESSDKPPNLPNEEIFEHGELGEVGTDDEERRFGKGSLGRTFEEVDPTTVNTQVTNLTIPTTTANLVHRSYFVIPTQPGPGDADDGGDQDFVAGSGKCGIWFNDTDWVAGGSNHSPPFLITEGEINHWIQVDYSSSAATSAADLAEDISDACNASYNNDSSARIFYNCTYSANLVRIVDFVAFRRPDNHTDIGTMNTSGNNYPLNVATSVDPTTNGNWLINTIRKGTAVGFNCMEKHFYTNEGDTGGDPETGESGENQVPYIASTRSKPHKKLIIGDYDCFVFFVSAACHLHSDRYVTDDFSGYPLPATYTSGAVPWTEGGQQLNFHHHACQDFIKSSLISRHNNCSNNDRFVTNTHEGSDAATSGWTVGSERNKYFFNSSYPAGERRLADAGTMQLRQTIEYLQNNGIYRHGARANGEYLDSSQSSDNNDWRWGIDLGYTLDSGTAPSTLTNARGNNTFFTPVHSIDICNSHTFLPMESGRNTTGALHSDTWGLRIEIHLYAVDPTTDQSGTAHDFCDSIVNCFWQPFGETAKLETAA